MDNVVLKTEAGVLLVRFKRVGHVTHFYKDTILMCDPLSDWFGPEISLFQCLQYESALEFPDYKKSSANNLSINFIIRNLYDPNMYSFIYVWLKETVHKIVSKLKFYSDDKKNI